MEVMGYIPTVKCRVTQSNGKSLFSAKYEYSIKMPNSNRFYDCTVGEVKKLDSFVLEFSKSTFTSLQKLKVLHKWGDKAIYLGE